MAEFAVSEYVCTCVCEVRGRRGYSGLQVKNEKETERDGKMESKCFHVYVYMRVVQKVRVEHTNIYMLYIVICTYLF